MTGGCVGSTVVTGAVVDSAVVAGDDVVVVDVDVVEVDVVVDVVVAMTATEEVGAADVDSETIGGSESIAPEPPVSLHATSKATATMAQAGWSWPPGPRRPAIIARRR